MAYDQGLAHRLSETLAAYELPELEEKKMFGGFCMMVRGNLCCGVIRQELLVRVHEAQVASLLKREGARSFDKMSGRPMKGWVLVSQDAVAEDPELASFLGPAIENALALPAKPMKSKPARAEKSPAPKRLPKVPAKKKTSSSSPRGLTEQTTRR